MDKVIAVKFMFPSFWSPERYENRSESRGVCDFIPCINYKKSKIVSNVRHSFASSTAIIASKWLFFL